jgi:hypothetical protein
VDRQRTLRRILILVASGRVEVDGHGPPLAVGEVLVGDHGPHPVPGVDDLHEESVVPVLEPEIGGLLSQRRRKNHPVHLDVCRVDGNLDPDVRSLTVGAKQVKDLCWVLGPEVASPFHDVAEHGRIDRHDLGSPA